MTTRIDVKAYDPVRMLYVSWMIAIDNRALGSDSGAGYATSKQLENGRKIPLSLKARAWVAFQLSAQPRRPLRLRGDSSVQGIHRGDAENAEIAQRVVRQDTSNG